MNNFLVAVVVKFLWDLVDKVMNFIKRRDKTLEEERKATEKINEADKDLKDAKTKKEVNDALDDLIDSSK